MYDKEKGNDKVTSREIAPPELIMKFNIVSVDLEQIEPEEECGGEVTPFNTC